MKSKLKNIINTGIRFINNLKRPSKRRNVLLVQKRNESVDAFTIRDATAEDIPALSSLHVKAWNNTYGKGPTIALRQQQWEAQFKNASDNWFLLVLENQGHELIGFAKGQRYKEADLPQFDGELNKIYLLRDYQRLGLGSRLFRAVAQRFLSMGIRNMVLFSIPQNPSCKFFEAMGGERLHGKGGEFHGGYGWKDLELPDQNQ
jgi:L-amino acid N-acyltransferase YncA